VALKELEYALPTVAPGTDAVLMLSGGGPELVVTVTTACADLVGSARLVAVMVAMVLPLTVGA
jgi:hypothetical protein